MGGGLGGTGVNNAGVHCILIHVRMQLLRALDCDAVVRHCYFSLQT